MTFELNFDEFVLAKYIEKQRYYFANKGPSSQGYGFSCGHVYAKAFDCLDHNKLWKILRDEKTLSLKNHIICRKTGKIIVG